MKGTNESHLSQRATALRTVHALIAVAKTHNLALTWATHFAADAVGLFALLLIL